MPTIMHLYFTLLLTVICHQAIASLILNHNTTKADLGHLFFRHMIDENESFKNINEENMCSLMHFFFREASHNGQSIQFSSGKST
jgi:hypothetical protein